MTDTAATQQRIPSKLVYLLASSMVCVGLGAWLISVMQSPDPESASPSTQFDTRTPEGTAEAFLDAWRRRDHRLAASLSTGLQHAAVVERAARDAEANQAEQVLKTQIWDQMAANPLRLRLDGSLSLEDGSGLVLEGTAEGSFLDRPYRRRVRFMMVEQNGEWKVHEMELGEIVNASPLPDPLDSFDDPGALKERGEDVP